MNRKFVLIFVALIYLPGCRQGGKSVENASDQNEPTPSGRFTRMLPDETGVLFENQIDPDHPMNRLFHSGFICGGVAIGDIDGDDLQDIYLVSGPESNRLFKNLGNFRFEDITSQSEVAGGDAWGTGATMVDIDNDGDLDLYVCNYDSPNLLYQNRGDGTFVEVAKKWNLDIVDACLMASFHDYDRDGDLDVYLQNNRYYRAHGRPKTQPWGFKNGKPYILDEYKKYYFFAKTAPGKYHIDDYGRPDFLLRNDGESFTDVSQQAGVTAKGFGLSATWWDYDSDGWPDIYVCNDFDDPDRLYHNNGDGTFTDKLVGTVPHTPWSAMGSDTGDLNNDGLMDLFCVDMSATNHFKQKTTMGAMNAKKMAQVAGPPPQYMRNAMYINSGTGKFLEAGYLAGLADTDWSWATRIADFDNDGRSDVFVSNGTIRQFNDSDNPFEVQMLIGQTRWDLYKHLPPVPEQNLAFKNNGDLSFKNVSKAWGLDHVGMSYGTALADLDGDHDLDMVVVNANEPVSLYRNDLSTGRGLSVRLVGSQSNRYGLGARLELTSSVGKQVRYVNSVRGFLASNEPVEIFGLAESESNAKLTIRWPSGKRQSVENLSSNQTLVVREDDETIAIESSDAANSPTLFVEGRVFDQVRHAETPFDDFELQPLLPNKLSQLGPGLAISDVDGDGDEDIYLCGAAGQAGSLLMNQSGERFIRKSMPAFENDANQEQMGCLFLDVDKDGDDDLIVVCGGVESHGSPQHFQDRLYINDGAGQFVLADKEQIPSESSSGSVVAAADFDRDGDLDLFIGGRVVPGKYPIAANSFLWRNDDGRFVDVTSTVADDSMLDGLVTSAVWSDVDGDGWQDLVVTNEWGPVKFFKNQQGKLVDKTADTGTGDLAGWFNGIAARDLDGDQDIDYVVTNFGLNTKYHASKEKPALLYYGDFERNGRMRLVEAEFEDETLFPIRGKSCSTHAMPFLGNKYKSYRDFALADLSDLYSDECLKESHRFAATTLESGVLINDGNFRFRFAPLPRLAQISPSFGVAISELNGDTSPDLLIAQNFHSPQVETGKMDGGLGLVLHGKGNGQFSAVWPSQSGFVVAEDAKSLAISDVDLNGFPDVIVGINDAAPRCFIRNGQVESNQFSVRLKGAKGNTHGVGARITVTLENGATQTAEVHAGGGYLSQSTPVISFGQADQVKEIKILWPDGSISIEPKSPGKRVYVIEYANR